MIPPYNQDSLRIYHLTELLLFKMTNKCEKFKELLVFIIRSNVESLKIAVIGPLSNSQYINNCALTLTAPSYDIFW